MFSISKMWLLFLLLSCGVVAELPSKIFDLPSLTINVEQNYLLRKQPTNLTCHLSAGWSGAVLENVVWMKDGETINATLEDDYFAEDITLTVTGGRAQSEGDYQCHAEVINITLSNKQVVNTRLVSSPIKLRRARITKFDKISEHMVSVKQGEIARLPCAGLPDVIPGPPEICFEKQGSEGCLGDRETGESNYLSTNTGIQIALVQPTDAGIYFCVVKNEYTKQNRTSPKSVILLVHPAEEISSDTAVAPDPVMVYPYKTTSYDKPMIIDAVEGQDILLECVISNAKVYWMKHNDTTPSISLTDEDARVRQLWGNLRFRSVSESDGGLYSCHGLSPLVSDPHLLDDDHPKVYYLLEVHGPTSVQLTLSENPEDKSWELSCLARNLRYEIPMAFVNGSALVDAIDQMGVASSTNFFTNPINATMKVNHSFSGSVQCISRPAMDEAEIYGNGLDRGRSQNVYVTNTDKSADEMIRKGPENTTVTVGDDVALTCVVQRVRSKYWIKDDHYVKILSKRTRVVGSNTLQVLSVELSDQGWYKCVVTGDGDTKNTASAYLTVLPRTTTTLETTTEPFEITKKDKEIHLNDLRGFVTGTNIRIQWAATGTPEALAGIANFRIEILREGASNDSWIEADRVGSHVRATTLKDLIPNHKYLLRVAVHLDDGSTVISNETNWMTVNSPSGDMPPASPNLTSVELTSSSSARVQWTHEAALANAKAKHFVVLFTMEGDNKSQLNKVDGNQTEAEIGDLLPDKIYTFNVVAENLAAKSPLSNQIALNTTSIPLMGMFSLLSVPSRQTMILAIAAFFVSLLMILICCVIACNIKTKRKKKANGKFLDTSYRIFNEQKVHKSRIYDDDNLFIAEDADECSPLKIKSEDRASLESSKFTFNRDGGSTVPNLYGNTDEIMEMEQAAPPRDPTYVSASKIIGSGIYGTTTARCYSPDSGTSHEMIVPYGGANGSVFNPSPLMTSSPHRVSAYKCPDSLLYSPAGTASSLADTSSSGQNNARLHCESPTNPPTDGSDQGIRCGGSSRNSQISSSDGRPVAMHTFKSTSPNTTSFIVNTFDRKNREQMAE